MRFNREMGGIAHDFNNLLGSIMGLAFIKGIAPFAIAAFGLVTLFQLVTLPVEFDASRRAMLSLQNGGYMSTDELTGAKKVLDAAALTYMSAAVTSILTLLYWAWRLGLFGGRRE